MKKLLMLGGSMQQIPAIKQAKEMGHYVITCDYCPDNAGHKYANEYYNVSTTDKDAVLRLAQELSIDGIVAYASDPAAPTAAYVAEKMGLPGSPYKSVCILTEKDLFRQFLKENGFNTPKAKGFTNYSDVLKEIDTFNFPVMVKPVDSSGGKGVVKVTEKEGNEFGNATLITKYGEMDFYKHFVSKDTAALAFITAKYKEPIGDNATLYTFAANDGIIKTYYLIELADGSAWQISFETPEESYDKDALIKVFESVAFVTAK